MTVKKKTTTKSTPVLVVEPTEIQLDAPSAVQEVVKAPMPKYEYRIETRYTVSDLQNAINDLLNEGWILNGGIAVAVVSTSYGVEYSYIQAVSRLKNG